MARIERVEKGEGWELHLAPDSWTWLRERGADTFDALITDPPYSSGGFTRGDRSKSVGEKYSAAETALNTKPDFDGDNRDQRGFLAWYTLWLTDSLRVLKSGAPVVLFTDWRQLPLTTDAMQAGGFLWRGIAVWAKTVCRPQMGRFAAQTEFAVWGSKGQMPEGKDIGTLPGVWSAPPVQRGNRNHVTEKPVPVMQQAVRIAPKGGLVLDLFAGSGSTGVACLREGRRFIGVERSPEYFEVACKRLREEEQTQAARRARRVSRAAAE